MKQVVLSIMLLCGMPSLALGQVMTPAVTVYKEFQPATVLLSSGKMMKLPLANIYLKNSSLLYVSGTQTKEANMRTLLKVSFKDRTYYRLDSLLAYRIDSIGQDGLYCAQKIDLEAWRQMHVNNTEITSMDLGDMLSYTTTDMANWQDIVFPVVNVYYYRLGERIVPADERKLKRVLSKEKYRLMQSIMAQKDFSWTREESLKELLKKIHE